MVPLPISKTSQTQYLHFPMFYTASQFPLHLRNKSAAVMATKKITTNGPTEVFRTPEQRAHNKKGSLIMGWRVPTQSFSRHLQVWKSFLLVMASSKALPSVIGYEFTCNHHWFVYRIKSITCTPCAASKISSIVSPQQQGSCPSSSKHNYNVCWSYTYTYKNMKIIQSSSGHMKLLPDR